MLKLDLKSEPFWLELFPGVRVLVKPAGTPVLMAARMQVALELPEGAAYELRLYFLKKAAQLAIIDWEGVGDSEGNPLPVTPDAVAALMDHYASAEAFETKYLMPAYTLEQEKNA